eukprot:gene27477-36254_t
MKAPNQTMMKYRTEDLLSFVVMQRQAVVCGNKHQYFEEKYLDVHSAASQELPEDLSKEEWYHDILKKGKEASDLGVATKAFQRLILQLDRSDGRPDIPINSLADKFYEFTSACLRCRGAVTLTAMDSQQAPSLWTAAIGPLEYVGLCINEHIRDVTMGDQVIRVVDVASLSLAAAQCLLDVDLRSSVSVSEREETAKKLGRLSKEQIRSVLDLSVSVVRIALRQALLQNVMQKHSTEDGQIFEKPAFTALELATRLPEGFKPLLKELSLVDLLIPSSVRLALILELDLRLPAEDMPIKGSNVFIVYKDSIPPTWFQNYRPPVE